MFTLSNYITHVLSSLLKFLAGTVYAARQLPAFCNPAHGQTQQAYYWNHDQVPNHISSAPLLSMKTANDRAVKGLPIFQLTHAR